nr:MAG TPA: hypothetical protein [Bacteriophage sp.]
MCFNFFCNIQIFHIFSNGHLLHFVLFVINCDFFLHLAFLLLFN